MIGIKCNNSDEVKNVVKKLIFINEIEEKVADTLMRDILTETCKGGYPVIIVKDYKDIKVSYNIETNMDIIPCKEYTVLNLFKKVESRHIIPLMKYLNVLSNCVSIHSISCVLEEMECEHNTEIEKVTEKYSKLVGKCFFVKSIEECETYYMRIIDFAPNENLFIIDYLSIRENNINFCENTTWSTYSIDDLLLTEITTETYNSTVNQYKNILNSFVNIK